jgi:maltose alpha-D-glucosyltransferase/alpha-amylase
MQQERVVPLRAQAAPASDRQWYKDAIIYQLHVRSFYDANGDGVGDFAGLTEKLDYIQDLGVTAIWLLPFFPSPLRDDGYDIADYTNVHPTYGALRDFKTFLREAHRRGLRVITELVLNHTSDQHEWFQRARVSPPGSKWRNYYVWSSTPDRYPDARIIFKDFEVSNWSLDPVAGAYYWHRFYHHQPDLNYDNPEVRQAMLRVLDFWFALGVDGLRLDAVPYLFEREGTNCENLPETHAYLKQLRRHIDERFGDKMLLAEANQWPEDAAAYFGDGDECHMNFHFPLMPRLFLAVEREDRFPIVDILEQTPPLPDGAQWAIFLRNHDELTLEMVTDEERDYMYRSYAADPQARINLGIRRRLAPLLRNNRRKIELMNGLLLSLPGTPIIYYGDEIGMGDNIYLGDRNSVRTPMQWSADRNAGFSRANPQKLFLPTIIDPEYHYALRNVEVEQSNPHSLLWWMRRTIALRKTVQAFGRGTCELLRPPNPKVLAFLRRYQKETILVVGNLSRFAQYVELDLSEFRGQTPVELFGQTQFPPIGELPYLLTLGPHAFCWFSLQWQPSEAVELAPSRLPQCRISGGPDQLFSGKPRDVLQQALEPFLKRHRWFPRTGRDVDAVELLDSIPVPSSPAQAPARLLLTSVRYKEGEPESYLLPVVLAQQEQASNILGDHPAAGILELETSSPPHRYTLCDATWERDCWLGLLRALGNRRQLRGRQGVVRSVAGRALRRLWDASLDVHDLSIRADEPHYATAVAGERLILKLLRRVSPGVHPGVELGRYLTERAQFVHVPEVVASMEYHSGDGEPITFAVLQEYVPHQADARSAALDELRRYFERVQSLDAQGDLPPEVADTHVFRSAESGGSALRDLRETPPNPQWVELAARSTPPSAWQLFGANLEGAELLGQRTGEMHLALAAASDDAAFRPEPFSKLWQRSWYQTLRHEVRRSLDALRRRLPQWSTPLRTWADTVAQREGELLAALRPLLEQRIAGRRLRVHGDFRLEHVLWTGKDFVIVDLEGDPERSIAQRRMKMPPLQDVASMILSLHTASLLAWQRYTAGWPQRGPALTAPEEWPHFWHVWVAVAFVRGYMRTARDGGFLPPDEGTLQLVLNLCLLQQALRGLQRTLHTDPAEAAAPLDALRRLLP